MKQNVKIISAALALIILVAIAGGSGLFSKKETKTNELAITPAIPKEFITLKTTSVKGNVYIHEIAREKGFLEDQGIKLETAAYVSGGPDSIQALIAGEVDVAHGAWQPWINAIKRGAKVKAVVAFGGVNEKTKGGSWLILENGTIKGPKDLVGKKIAINTLGAESDYITRVYLKQNGVSIDQVQLLVVPYPQMDQVLRSGQVDVVSVGTPNSDKILAGGGVKVLSTTYDIRGKVVGSGLGVSEDLIKQNPEAVKKFVTAIGKAWDWSEENPEEARKVVVEILKKKGDNPDLAKYWNPSRGWEGGLIKDSDLQWWLDWLVKDGVLTEGQIKPSDIFTNEFNPYDKQ